MPTVALQTRGDLYAYRYDLGGEGIAMQAINEAVNVGNLDWFEGAILFEQIRQQMTTASAATPTE